MQRLLILVPDRVVDSSLAITLETFNAGASFLSRKGRGGQIEVKTAGFSRFVQTGAGMRLKVDMTYAEMARSDYIPHWAIVPGAGMTSDDQIQARLLSRDTLPLMNVLRDLNEGGVRIGASCASVFFLAQAGLLSQRSATTTWWLANVFRSRYGDVKLDESRMLVRDGHFLTAGASLSQLDLVLAIVTEVMGVSVAHLCSRYMLIDQRPSQARYMMLNHIQNTDATVVAAEKWVDRHVANPISVEELASHLAMSSKTLARRLQAATGVSPVKFIQRRKLLHAVHLIETTGLSIEAVAEQIGYQDTTALRKLVKRELGTTPGSLR